MSFRVKIYKLRVIMACVRYFLKMGSEWIIQWLGSFWVYNKSKNKGNTKDIFFFKTQVSFLGTLFFSEQTIGSKILSKCSSVWCVLLLTYPLTHSSLQPFWCQLLWMMKGRTQTFRQRRRTAAGTTVAPPHRAAAPAGLSMSVAENLLDTEHTLN